MDYKDRNYYLQNDLPGRSHVEIDLHYDYIIP